MKKRWLLCLVVFVILNAMFISGCSAKHIHDEEARIVGQDVILYKEASIINDEQANTVLSQEPTTLQLQQNLGEISFKQLGVLIYTVVRTPKHLYLVWFDEAGKYSFNREIVFSDIESKTKIERIKKGDDLDSVMQADKCGEYDFLFASWSGFPQISYHFFEDGSAYEIHYKDSVVSEVYVFTI